MKKITGILFFISLLCFGILQAEAKVKTPKNKPVSVPSVEMQNKNTGGRMDEKDVPAVLKDWIKWVTYDHEKDECVSGIENSGKYCNYLSEVKVDVAGNVFKFSMRLKSMKDGYVQIVGDETVFPDQVISDGKRIPVVSRSGLPHVYLKKGEYVLNGRGKSSATIYSLRLPANTVIVRVSENDRELQTYNFENGLLRIENNKISRKSDTDTVSLTVFRKIKDGIPLKMILRLDMNVSGKERTENFGRIIPRNFAVKSISSPFPAYFSKDGNLMADVHAGNHTMEIEFRQLKESLDLNVDLLSSEELWVFEKDESFRIIKPPVELTPVDTKNTTLPETWRRLPAYLIDKDSNIVLNIEPEIMENNDVLSLKRKMKLAYDGSFYSVEDKIRADIKKDGRLSLEKPFVLSSAKVGKNPVMITAVSGERNGGIEIRNGDREIEINSRINVGDGEIAVSGYNRVFDNVSWKLILAPGYRLFHVFGADKVSSSWVNSWDLLGAFEVMVLAVIFFYLFGFKTAFLSELGLILLHPQFPVFTYVAFILSLMVFVLRYIPEKSSFAAVIKFVKYTLLCIIGYYLLLFFVPNLVNAIYPETYHEYAVKVNKTAIFAFYVFSAVVYFVYRIIKNSERRTIKKYLYVAAVIFLALFVCKNIAGIFSEYEVYDRRIASMSMDSMVMEADSAPLYNSSIMGKAAKAHKYQSLNIARNIVQTGFGFPTWDESKGINISFSGNVDEKMTIKILLMTPTVNMVLAFLRFLFTAYVLYVFAGKKAKIKVAVKSAAVMTAFLVLLPYSVSAAEYPSAAMLEELKSRLTYEEPSKCLPNACISYPVASIYDSNDTFTIKLTAYALETVVAPLPELKPEGNGYANLKSVTVGKKDASLTRYNGKNAILLNKGENNIEITYSLDRNVERFILSSYFKINLLEQHLNGFSLSHEAGRMQSYQLNRKSISNILREEKESKINVEPFFRVERIFNIDTMWQINTVVYKETENRKTATVEIPLLKGEKVISNEGILTRNKIRLTFAANEHMKTFSSVLPVEEAINITSADSLEKYREIWRFSVSNMWSVRYEGIQPVYNGGKNSTEFHPTAGKSLTVNIFKPDGVPGNVVTVDKVTYDVTMQKDFTDMAVRIVLRSSESGIHNIVVPKDVSVKSLYVAGRPYPIVIKDKMLGLPINKGDNNIRVVFRSEKPESEITNVPNIDLNAPAVDVDINVVIPQNRWVIFAKGPVKGPAVLFIPMIPVLLVISFVLSRLKLYPLGIVSWFVLLLGLSQTDIICNLTVIAWFIAMGLREKYSSHIQAAKKVVQSVLCFMSLLFVLALLNSIKTGLLGSPDMFITGNNSSSNMLKWYIDIVDAVTPDIMVVSLPVFFYKVTMLLWAGWLAFSFVKWIKWGIEAFSKDGLWGCAQTINTDTSSAKK